MYKVTETRRMLSFLLCLMLVLSTGTAFAGGGDLETGYIADGVVCDIDGHDHAPEAVISEEAPVPAEQCERCGVGSLIVNSTSTGSYYGTGRNWSCTHGGGLSYNDVEQSATKVTKYKCNSCGDITSQNDTVYRTYCAYRSTYYY